MIEYHGWLVIRAALVDDPEPDADQEAMDLARSLFEELPENERRLIDLRWINGVAQLHAADTPNHFGPRVSAVLDRVRAIARDAPGSYGLFYIHDDEDSDRDDEFRVLVVKRGEVTEQRDPFLSPVTATLEGPPLTGDGR